MDWPHQERSGSEIAFSWSPVQLKILHWRQNFTTGRQRAINYAILCHDNYTKNSFDFQPFKAACQLVTFFLPFRCFGSIKPISFYYKSTTMFYSYEQCEASLPCFFQRFPIAYVLRAQDAPCVLSPWIFIQAMWCPKMFWNLSVIYYKVETEHPRRFKYSVGIKRWQCRSVKVVKRWFQD